MGLKNEATIAKTGSQVCEQPFVVVAAGYGLLALGESPGEETGGQTFSFYMEDSHKQPLEANNINRLLRESTLPEATIEVDLAATLLLATS